MVAHGEEVTPAPISTMDLPVDNLVPNKYNPNVMEDLAYTRLYLTMKEMMRTPSPLWVRCLKDGKNHLEHNHEIIDGFHRWYAAKELNIKKVTCEIFRVDDIEAMAMCYRVNTSRGTPNPFKEGYLFSQAMRLAPKPETVYGYFTVSPDYVAKRLQLYSIYHIYEKYADREDIQVGHWEVMAKFWKGHEDDETLHTICQHMETGDLTVKDVQQVLSEYRPERKTTATSKYKATGPSDTGKSIDIKPSQEPGGSATPQPISEAVQPYIQVETVERQRVERKAWEDKVPPTAQYLVKCFWCKEECQIVVWEEAGEVQCSGCGRTIRIVDDEGNLKSTVKRIVFRPKEKPFNRIYVPARYKDLGTE